MGGRAELVEGAGLCDCLGDIAAGVSALLGVALVCVLAHMESFLTISTKGSS